ncbi:hypothetical protein MACJ_002464 [Theileria orientalis]|uniref:Uncharacterized protein n=1 Tax=Theileria orientalis TaxID=68886 RepID=A0A976QSP9_THEOR|nr:hypothetical protein MACJ_002464 [Theileria orientalis]
MGSTQSKPKLNIHLLSKVRQYPQDRKDYSVTISKKTAPKSKNFEEVTHTINYHNTDAKNFDIYIYNSEGQSNDFYYIFGYYPSSDDSEVVTQVKSYNSIFLRNLPLIISFVTLDGKTHDCKYDDLFDARRSRVSNIKNLAFVNDLNKQLEIEFEKVLSKNRIRFSIENGNDGTIGYNKEIENDEMYYKSFYIPLQPMSTLGSNCLFEINKDHKPICSKLIAKDKNKIDPYFFGLVKDKSYRGIVLYLAKDGGKPPEQFRGEDDTLLLLEFIKSANSKIHIKRKDDGGYWWDEKQVQHQNDDELLQELSKIKEDAKLEDVVTVILDIDYKYKGLHNFEKHPEKTYNKYIHTFLTAKNPNPLFGRKTIKIKKLNTKGFKTRKVEVYYLKAKEAQGEREDTHPFLIVFNEYETGSVPSPKLRDSNKRIYHFKNTEEFDNWEHFQKGEYLKDIGVRLELKLARIDDECSLLSGMDSIRTRAYEILIAEDEKSTIKFKIGTASKGTRAYAREINDKSNYKHTYTTWKPGSTLGSNCLFKIDNTSHRPICSVPLLNSDKNKIDKYFLSQVKNNNYAGIMAYFDTMDEELEDKPVEKDKLLLLEFIVSGGLKKYIRRRDVNGCWWSEEEDGYVREEQLFQQLSTIKSEAEGTDPVTIILDIYSKYKGVSEFKRNTRKKAYNKYTHIFDKAKNPVTLYKRREKTICNLDTKFNTKNVEVYYLKAEGRQDEYPFLIVLEDDKTKNSPEPEKTNKKIYHFNGTEEFDKWMEFREGKPIEYIQDHLESRLNKINSRGSCSPTLHLLRRLAYQVLTEKYTRREHHEPDLPEVETEPTPQPPEEEDEDDEEEEEEEEEEEQDEDDEEEDEEEAGGPQAFPTPKKEVAKPRGTRTTETVLNLPVPPIIPREPGTPRQSEVPTGTILIIILGIVAAAGAVIGTILGRRLLSNLATRTITNMVPSL